MSQTDSLVARKVLVLLARLMAAHALVMLVWPATAETVKEPHKSEWLYFNAYEPECFLDEGSALADRMATHQAATQYCAVRFEQWTSQWPNGDAMSSYNKRCPPVSGVPYAYGYVHEEGRAFRWAYDLNCSGTFYPSNDYILRHFFYYCDSGYKLYRPYINGVGYAPVPICTQVSEVPDREKNLGGHCPKDGNPIQSATGNKFEQETDYLGVGAFPL